MDLKRIREALERKGLKQKAAAKFIGVSESQMSRFLSAERRLRLDEAIKLAEFLGLAISDIPVQDTQALLPPASLERRNRSLRTTLPLAEGAAIVEYPATLSPHSRKVLKTWLELMAQLAEPE